MLKKNVGEMNAGAGREDQQEHPQEADRTSRGNFGSLMMMGYDEEGAMVRHFPLFSHHRAREADSKRSLDASRPQSPLPAHPLSPTFLPYQQDRNSNISGVDENGFVPLAQMPFERKEPRYRSPIDSIFETYEGEDTTAADSRTSYAGSYVYT